MSSWFTEREGEWQHSSGWTVNHCGHPTANWPYYLNPPNSTQLVVSFNGHGFQSVAVAKKAVEGIVCGYLKVTKGRVNITARGDTK